MIGELHVFVNMVMISMQLEDHKNVQLVHVFSFKAIFVVYRVIKNMKITRHCGKLRKRDNSKVKEYAKITYLWPAI